MRKVTCEHAAKAPGSAGRLLCLHLKTSAAHPCRISAVRNVPGREDEGQILLLPAESEFQVRISRNKSIAVHVSVYHSSSAIYASLVIHLPSLLIFYCNY